MFVFVFNFQRKQKEPTVSAEGATLAPMGRVNPLGLLPYIKTSINKYFVF